MSEILEVWTLPSDYAGHSPTGDYLIYSRTRDSEIIEDVNFTRILEDLSEMDDEVYSFTASHWAVGWVEYIIVPADASTAVIEKAEEIVSALSDYPIYDEDAVSEAGGFDEDDETEE